MSFSSTLDDAAGATDDLTFGFTTPPVGPNADGFPPAGPTVVQAIIPAYLYQQYRDDESLQALIAAFNIVAQRYLSWFVTVGLPIYPGLTGDLLTWVASNLYGQPRPKLAYGVLTEIGPLDTWTPDEIGPDEDFLSGNPVPFFVSDDFYKRVLTWNFFKGDGRTFTVRWLKRRIFRFLYGVNGVSPAVIGPTYQISVVPGLGNQINVRIIEATITTTLDAAPDDFFCDEVTPDECDTLATPLPPVPWATVLQALFLGGWLELPLQYTYTFTIISGVPAANYLSNVSGVLNVAAAALYPSSPAGLNPGDVWSDAGVVSIVPPTSPDPSAAPVYFPGITDVALLAMGAQNLPLVAGPAGSGLVWNNSGVANVS